MKFPAVRVDPITGRKVFATRAESTYPTEAASGFGLVDDARLTSLPGLATKAEFDELQQERYRVERDSRRGAGDYVSLEGEHAEYFADVHTAEPVPREPLTDSCDVLVVGAGFAGLMLCQKLIEAGFDDIRFCERGGDVGGTWYWNRYPGVACDIESYSYLPLLDEMGYIPTMKYASGLEIWRYCQMVAERVGLYERCLFNTAVTEATWDDVTGRWSVRTDRGDEMTVRALVLANGILSTPKLARIDGMESFRGHSFHTSRWDHSADLAGKRVGVIGTGATAVQVVPELAKVVSDLFVFQRTPSTVDVRGQRATTEDERREWSDTPGWARARRDRFAALPPGRAAMLADDDYLSGKVERTFPPPAPPTEETIRRQLEANFGLMERIRARVDRIVVNPGTAATLKPYYTYGCKRPTFHDEYLPAFNLPHVHLVDASPTGVERITEHGVVHDGVEYELDAIVYATGFQWMDNTTFSMVRDGRGEPLADKWKRQGTSTFLGVHSHGFPNLFVIIGPQGGGGTLNFTTGIETHCDYITWMLTHMREQGHEVVDVRKESEDRWAEHCRDADVRTSPLRDCSSYYNRDGTAAPGSLSYYGGAATWLEHARIAQGSLDPFVFRSPSARTEHPETTAHV